MEKLHRSIPASGSSKMQSLCGLASTDAISSRFISPPERVASISLLKYSFAHKPTRLNRLQQVSSESFSPAAKFKNRSTVIPLKRGGCWNANPIPAFARSAIGNSVISCLSSKICPPSGFSIPIRSFAIVDLPPPLGPVITSISPSGTAKLISSIILFSTPLSNGWKTRFLTSSITASVFSILLLFMYISHYLRQLV